MIGKGIEPHPTDGYHSVSFSNDIETHGASTISTPVMPCESSRFASPLSTQHNILYSITSSLSSQIVTFFIFFCGGNVLGCFVKFFVVWGDLSVR